MEQEQNKLSIPLAIVAAGALIAGAIYFGGGPTSSRQPVSETIDIKVPTVTAEDHYLGSPDAEIIIVEYSDTECPYCKRFHNDLKNVLADNAGHVAWVYRHFPIAQLHTLAPKEAEATECAAELGGNQVFWRYIDTIYETTKSNDTLDPSLLPRIASNVGLNVADFNTCLESGRYTDKIDQSIKEAVEAGARGTPYSILILRQAASKNQVEDVNQLVTAERLFDQTGKPLVNVSKDLKMVSISGAMSKEVLNQLVSIILK